MKKIILCLLAVVALASCAPSKYEEAKTTDAEYIKVKTKMLDIFKFNYSGHSYIMFDGTSHLNGVVHDPDCSCHKTNETDFGF